MSSRAKVERFSVEDNGFVKVLHCPKPTIPNGQTTSKVVQRVGSKRVSLRTKVEPLSIEDNGFLKVSLSRASHNDHRGEWQDRPRSLIAVDVRVGSVAALHDRG